MKDNYKKVIALVIVLLIGISLACGTGVPVTSTDAPSLPTIEEQPSLKSPQPTNTSLPATATSNTNSIEPGTYIIGADIKAGIYKGIAGEDLYSSCYWERLKDFALSYESIIAHEISYGQFYIEVKASDYALATDCQLIRLATISEHTGEYPHIIAIGTYLVGNEIQPGTYEGQAGADMNSSCYWARRRNVTGDSSSLIAKDDAVGQFYVQVLKGDFALTTRCELEWVGE